RISVRKRPAAADGKIRFVFEKRSHRISRTLTVACPPAGDSQSGKVGADARSQLVGALEPGLGFVKSARSKMAITRDAAIEVHVRIAGFDGDGPHCALSAGVVLAQKYLRGAQSPVRHIVTWVEVKRTQSGRLRVGVAPPPE